MCHSDSTQAVPSAQDGPKPQTPCDNVRCTVSTDNILIKYPNLRFPPRPEPTQAGSADHATWLSEFEEWGSLQCDCGRGYFCREHGDWISGPEVGSGIAPSREDQKHGFCPANHYEDPSGRESYVGQRDGLAF